MSRNFLGICALGAVLACSSLSSCKVQISVPSSGSVVSKSGSYNCEAGKVCVLDVYDTFFDETFTGVPGPGFGFAGWKKRAKGFCWGSIEPCHLTTTDFPGHQGLMKVLQSDAFFYLEPVFAKPDVWSQLGRDISGKAPEDGAGASVSFSADGNRLAIGARWFNGTGETSGQVRVFEWTGTRWQQRGADVNAEAGDDRFGSSVSLSADGNRLAVGAPKNDGNGAESGQVRVYRYAGASNKWLQIGADIDGEESQDYSGDAVSLSAGGNRLAVGAPGNDGAGDNSGHVRVYRYVSQHNAWQQIGQDIDGKSAGAQFGDRVSMSDNGNRLAIAAPRNSDNGDTAGQVRVYQWSGEVWEQLGEAINGEAAGDNSGQSLSLAGNGNSLAIGAPSNDGNGEKSGHVRVYAWSGNAWLQRGADIDGEAAGDRSGWSVALAADGSLVAVGARTNDGNGQFAGHARVYAFASGRWQQRGDDIDGARSEDLFGYSVDLSDAGDWLAVGAAVPNKHPGYVRVFGAPL